MKCIEYVIMACACSFVTLSAQNVHKDKRDSTGDPSFSPRVWGRHYDRLIDPRLRYPLTDYERLELRDGNKQTSQLSSEQHSILTTSSNGVDTAWMRYYGSALVPSEDGVSAMVLDASGNIYVTGNSGGDYVTLKYNVGGVLQWVTRYNSTGNSYDFPSSVAVDGSGNVYVTGSSEETGGGYDYATIKYNLNGNLLWVRRYDGPPRSSDGNSYDFPSSIAVDSTGNVYVTGDNTGINFITIKYNSNGDTLWVRSYDGVGFKHTSSLAVDGSGNVYVTGYTYVEGGPGDVYVTIKYNSKGDTLWVKRYDGMDDFGDYAYALAIDESENVYVTGNTATIKYNSNGDTLWIRTYPGHGNVGEFGTTFLAVDENGNVYVTGGFGDYATIKYDSNGNMLWTKTFTGNATEITSSLAVDASGNVYVTGQSFHQCHVEPCFERYPYTTIKYNQSGEEQWIVTSEQLGWGAAIAVDGSGNVVVAAVEIDSTQNSDCITIKFNSNGDTLWVQRYDGPKNSNDQVSSLAIDGNGNVYVTGTSVISISNYVSDYATIKYNPNGDALWTRRYSGPGIVSKDIASSIAVDGSANVYVTGRANIVTGGMCGPFCSSADVATIKYNANGDTIWTNKFHYAPDFYQQPSVAVNQIGDVHVSGGNTVIKYNSSGNTLWERRYDSSGSVLDFSSLAIDENGNVYVTGGNSASLMSDFTTIKHNSSGDTLWLRTFIGPPDNYSNPSKDYATSLVVDGSGNVYVTGYSGSELGHDFVTIKYNSTGDSLWVTRYNSGFDDYARSLAVDGSGNVYVTGTSGGDYATIKYNASGDTIWVRRSTGGSPTSLAIDESGNVYVTGSGGTIKYNSAGVQQWIAPGDRVDLAIDGSRNVYVTGSTSSGNSSFYTTIKYVQTPTSVEEKKLPTPSTFGL